MNHIQKKHTPKRRRLLRLRAGKGEIQTILGVVFVLAAIGFRVMARYDRYQRRNESSRTTTTTPISEEDQRRAMIELRRIMEEKKANQSRQRPVVSEELDEPEDEAEDVAEDVATHEPPQDADEDPAQDMIEAMRIKAEQEEERIKKEFAALEAKIKADKQLLESQTSYAESPPREVVREEITLPSRESRMPREVQRPSPRTRPGERITRPTATPPDRPSMRELPSRVPRPPQRVPGRPARPGE